jgi:hypothetical protein
MSAFPVLNSPCPLAADLQERLRDTVPRRLKGAVTVHGRRQEVRIALQVQRGMKMNNILICQVFPLLRLFFAPSWIFCA